MMKKVLALALCVCMAAKLLAEYPVVAHARV